MAGRIGLLGIRSISSHCTASHCLPHRQTFYRHAWIYKDTVRKDTVRTMSSAEKPDTKLERDFNEKEQEISEFMKKIHASDHRPPIGYRRQNYPNPIARAVGIITDDIKIFFQNIAFSIKTFYWLIVKPEKLAEELELEKRLMNEKYQQLVTGSKKVAADAGAPPVKPVTKFSDLKSIRQKYMESKNVLWPAHCDVLIIGGGAIGASIAYHVKKNAGVALNVVLVEKDPTYKTASTVLSVGGIRQQFSIPENILLSLYGMDFMRNIPRLLHITDNPPPSLNFHPHGYLTLASEKGREQLKENFMIQRECEAKVAFLEPSQLKERFPWMSTDGLSAGVLGLENEGWFDPWSLLIGLRRKAESLGVTFIDGDVTDFQMMDDLNTSTTFTDGFMSNSEQRVKYAVIRLPNGEVRTIGMALLVMAAGYDTGRMCKDMIGIGTAKEGIMAYPVPIEPRKRYVFCFHAPKGPSLNTPLVIDPTGAYFRREGLGNIFLAGMSPPEDEEPDVDNLDVDHDYFTEKIWPIIAHRVPSFEELKVQGSWAGFYEYNVFDQNGIIGMHPLVNNIIIASGFSGHGIQHSLGVGRAVMELIIYNEFRTINLERFAYDRIILNKPLHETGIV